MKSKLIAPFLLASTAVLSLNTHAVMAPPSASSTIDWGSFHVQVFDTDMNDGITAAISWTNQGSNVGSFEGLGNYNSSSDWGSVITVTDGVANGYASSALLASTFTAPPTGLNANSYASRYGDFSVTANTVLLFSVSASTSINLNTPINGNAYAWATLDVVGTNGDTQHGTASKLSWAAGLGNPVEDSGLMKAYFVNLSETDITGNLNVGTSINSYGFIPAVPEPETYAMLLAGLGLMGFIARRRMK